LIYAIPDFELDVNYYPAYLPSYFGNSVNWMDANSIIPTGSMFNQDIHLVSNTEILYGSDTITGSLNVVDQNSFEYNVYYGNWFGNMPGGSINFDKAPNMPVLLLNSMNEPMRFTVSDENGDFIFTDLPVRIYKIYPEKPGFATFPGTVNLTTTAASSQNCTLAIGTSSISIGVENPSISEFQQNIHVFPNPVGESLSLSLLSEEPQNINISIINVDGKEVIKNEKFYSFGKEQFLIPVSSLTFGVYFLKIQPINGSATFVKIIKM
jgi:hypothetical protein